jgi:Tfp pilus assembly pilus retraction ATPase PilT
LINNMIQTGKSKGMISMDQSIMELVKAGVVEPGEALERALDKETFKSSVAGAPVATPPKTVPAAAR